MDKILSMVRDYSYYAKWYAYTICVCGGLLWFVFDTFSITQIVLTIGMAIFILSYILKLFIHIPEDYDWTKVYPELLDKNTSTPLISIRLDQFQYISAAISLSGLALLIFDPNTRSLFVFLFFAFLCVIGFIYKTFFIPPPNSPDWTFVYPELSGLGDKLDEYIKNQKRKNRSEFPISDEENKMLLDLQAEFKKVKEEIDTLKNKRN